jgi:uncharacterized protein YndB with AHSA1/START domain
VTLRAPRSGVWRAITAAEEFGAWFDVKLDGAFAESVTIRDDQGWTEQTRNVERYVSEP